MAVCREGFPCQWRVADWEAFYFTQNSDFGDLQKQVCTGNAVGRVFFTYYFLSYVQWAFIRGIHWVFLLFVLPSLVWNSVSSNSISLHSCKQSTSDVIFTLSQQLFRFNNIKSLCIMLTKIDFRCSVSFINESTRQIWVFFSLCTI